MDMKRFFLYAIVIAALTLAGCGGGGGGTTAMPVDPTPPDPPAMVTCPDGTMAASMDACPSGPTPEEMALEAAQDAAMAAYMAAKMALYGAVDTVAMQTAQKYADMAKEANDAAQAATASAMAEEYQMAAETARDQAQEAAMMRGLGITILANKITNQSAIDNAVLEDRDPPKPVSNAGRVGTELQATASETGAAAVAHTDGSVTPGSVTQGGTASAMVVYGESGPAITVADVGTTLRMGESPVDVLMMRGGWKGRELLEDGDSDTYVNVYTDIQAPKMMQNYGVDSNTAPGAGHIITGDIPGDGTTFTGTRNLSATDNIPTETGRFNCATPGSCSISVDEDGAITAIQGYTFQPIADGMTSTPDADYLAWGVWLTVPDAVADTDVASSAGAFASGSNVFEVRAALKGKATYNGVASGLYSAGGMVEDFDADVMLEANFGGIVGADNTPDTGTVGDNDGNLLGVVTGTVSNINAGGMAVGGSLMLGRATVTTDTNNGDSVGGFEGETSGTLVGRAMAGVWGGQFYGLQEAAADSMAAQTEYPTTAAGTFAAHAPGNVNDPVRILGAFGSWKAE